MKQKVITSKKKIMKNREVQEEGEGETKYCKERVN